MVQAGYECCSVYLGPVRPFLLFAPTLLVVATSTFPRLTIALVCVPTFFELMLEVGLTVSISQAKREDMVAGGRGLGVSHLRQLHFLSRGVCGIYVRFDFFVFFILRLRIDFL